MSDPERTARMGLNAARVLRVATKPRNTDPFAMVTAM